MMLNLSEKLFILTLNDENGAVQNLAAMLLPYALAGTLLADLTLLEKIRLDQDKKIAVVSTQSCEDKILDIALQSFLGKDRPYRVSYWIDAFSAKPHTSQERIISSLIQKGILTQDKKRLLWVIPSLVYPFQKASTKYVIKLQLRAMVLAEENPNSRALILLGLKNTCNMLDLIFTKDERKAASRKINELVNSEIINQVFQHAINDIFLAAAMAPAIK